MIISKNIVLLLLLVSNIAMSDMSGSYEYSLEKYPKLTKLLNYENNEGDYSLVNIHMENDGIASLSKIKDVELLLVNYITANPWATNYYVRLIEVKSDEYRFSTIKLPYENKLEIEGSVYSWNKKSSYVDNGKLFLNYKFVCKKPATFVEVGSCSDNVVYEVIKGYNFDGKNFINFSTKVNKI